jgi:uncharacterized protein (DUF169 family)
MEPIGIWNRKGELLSNLLQLKAAPVAVKILKGSSDFPDDAKRPVRDFGLKIAMCQAIAMARKFGWTVAMGPEDNVCPSSKILWGWAEFDKMNFAKTWVKIGIGENTDSTMKSIEAMPKLPVGECRGIVFSPLVSTKFIPDLVLMYCNTAQAMKLINAYTYKEGGGLTFTSQARTACAESIIPTVQANRPNLAIPCRPDRSYGMTQDDELIFTLPAEKVQDVIQAIQFDLSMGVAFSLRQRFVWQPDLSAPYRELDNSLKPV